MTDKQKMLPPDALASRILCGRHNSVLSELDGLAVRLFRAFDEQDARDSGQQLLFLFSGHDLERWLLKVLCGLVNSGNLAVNKPDDLKIPTEWVEILFGVREFHDHQGVYVCRDVGHIFSGPHGLKMKAFAPEGKLDGLGLLICGYEFILSMSGLPNRRFDGRNFAYRPFEFYAKARGFEKSVVFSWMGESDGGTITSVLDQPLG